MKKIILFTLILLHSLYVFGQKNDTIGQMTKAEVAQIWQSFENGDATRVVTEQDMYLIRVHNTNGKVVSDKETYTILSTPIPPHINSSKDLQKWLNLPPSSTAENFSLIKVPAGTELWAGPIAAGNWDKDSGRWFSQKTNWLDGANARNGGAIQIVIPNTNFAQVTTVEGWQNRKFEDIREVYKTYQSSDAGLKPIIDYKNVYPNSNSEKIEEKEKKYGKMPGGILVESTAFLKTGIIESVDYNYSNGSFLINNQFSYKSGLRPDEIAQIAQIIFERQDKRLAALSQTEVINANLNTSVARSLVEADILLGKILYGYSCENGNGFTKNNQVEGYKNPLITSRKRLTSFFNWSAKKTDMERISKGLEERVFLSFDNIIFDFNKNTNYFEPVSIGCKVNYQAFTYDKNGKKVFSSDEDLQRYFPELVANAKHLTSNFNLYTEKYPELLKAQKIAEVYALLMKLYENNTPIENKGSLLAQRPYIFPFEYHSFDNIGPESDFIQYHERVLNSINWIPDWIFFNKETKFKWINYKLYHALNAMNFEKIKKYRAQALLIAKGLDDSKISDETKLIKEQINKQIPTVILGKINYAERNNSIGCIDSAIAYIEFMNKIEPQNPYYDEELAALNLQHKLIEINLMVDKLLKSPLDMATVQIR